MSIINRNADFQTLFQKFPASISLGGTSMLEHKNTKNELHSGMMPKESQEQGDQIFTD